MLEITHLSINRGRTLYIKAHAQNRILISHFPNKEVTLKLRPLVCKLGTFKSTPQPRVMVWLP